MPKFLFFSSLTLNGSLSTHAFKELKWKLKRPVLMTPKLDTSGAWSRLRSLARTDQAFCAVPYFGTGASKQLPLKPGSCLVVRFDRSSVQSGQVNPKEIIRLIKRGVDVHACANLHAKVFVFGNTAIIGSTNVSTASEHHLIEACVEI